VGVARGITGAAETAAYPVVLPIERGGEGSVLGGDASAGFFTHFALTRAQVWVISAGEAEVSAVVLGPSENRGERDSYRNSSTDSVAPCFLLSTPNLTRSTVVRSGGSDSKKRGSGRPGGGAGTSHQRCLRIHDITRFAKMSFAFII